MATPSPVRGELAFPLTNTIILGDDSSFSRWTGQPPVEGCPGYDAGVIRSLPLPDISSTGTRQGLLEYFDNTWTLTEVLFSGLLVSISHILAKQHSLSC
jgi:hypothetical protein